MSEAVGVIIAAIIAGWVAFFSLIISKERTVSDFRQKWIDELRRDIAAIVAHVSNIQGASATQRKDEAEQLWAYVRTDLTQFYEAIARIRLRLNPGEKRKKEGSATKAVLGALKELESIFADSEPQFYKLPSLLATLATHTQVILKENWKRVRTGERTYWITKWITFAFAFALIAVLLRLLYVFKGTQWLLHAFNVIW